jgi:hypothetical protein
MTIIILNDKQKKAIAGLRWGSTHGLFGIATVVLGGLLLAETIFWSKLDLYYTILPYLYFTAAFGNAFVGYSMPAPKHSQFAFRASAVFQMCLLYYMVRFLPSYRNYSSRYLDIAVCFPLLTACLQFLRIAFQQTDTALQIALSVGTLALSLTLFYPLQLAWDPLWLNCLLENRYPAQDLAMSVYIYMPATYTFALILFGATLYLRRIITDTQLGLMSLCLVTFTLLGTVLLQEIQLPEISAQELIMACPSPNVWETATSPRPILDVMMQTKFVQWYFGLIGAHRMEEYYTMN